MKRNYRKNYSLLAVKQFQKQILKKGGKIDRHSDLVAYFEGKSLNPDVLPLDLLRNLIFSNNSEKTKDLFKLEEVHGKNIPHVNGNNDNSSPLVYEYKRMDLGSKVIPGYKTGILYQNKEQAFYWNLDNDLLDNEFALYHSWKDYVIILNPKYIDILRLIKNGYNPDKEEIKKNRNLLPAIILAVGLILASFIYAFSNRYEVVKGNGPYFIVDKWTHQFINLTKK